MPAPLRAVRAAGIAAGLTFVPVSSSSSRTALADVVIGRTQLLADRVGACCHRDGFASGLLAMLIAALGALVVICRATLIDLSEFRRLARFRRSELHAGTSRQPC